MAKSPPISSFFAKAGVPLRNFRWSWGASHDGKVLLRTWQDRQVFKERTVEVLGPPAHYLARDTFGLDERIKHLRLLWQGNAAGYTVIVTAKDTASPVREVADYRPDKVYVIERLRLQPDGAIVAVLNTMVDVDALTEHAKSFKTLGGDGPFPVDAQLETGLSTADFATKIPLMRKWLIELARRKSKATYGEVMDQFGMRFFLLRNAMGRLGHECQDLREPILTSLIVDKDSGLCSDGLREEFGVQDDQAERERCYAHWDAQSPVAAAASTGDSAAVPVPVVSAVPAEVLTLSPVPPGPDDGSLEARLMRFRKTAARPEQAAFREAVFRACEGRCVVSGCAVPEALDAAHLLGRDWRLGHNQAEDGMLLRRDLHALYDNGLLMLSDAGVVSVSPQVVAHYGEFDGKSVGPSRSGVVSSFSLNGRA
jgi:hypothetical protein